MKQFKVILPLAAVSVFFTASSCSAREAQMLDFGQPTEVQGEVEQVPDARIPPKGALQHNGRPGQGTIAPGLTMTNISVPSWMRRSRSSSLLAGVPTLPLNALENCGAPSYRPNPRLSREAEGRRYQLYPLVMAIACEAGIPGHLFDALIAQESRYNPAALSPKGAAGLAQLMPDTAITLGLTNRFDTMQNLRGGARYLRSQLDEFGRYDLALGAYNAGPGRIRQYKTVPPFRETIAYVKTILTDVRAALFERPVYPLIHSAQKVRTASLVGF